MRKILALMLALFAASIFAADWHSNAERMEIKPRIASKDTVWYSYAQSGSGWVMQVPMERATYYQIDDFTIEYPSILHGVDTYLFDIGEEFTYKVYAKDGVTLLWESAVVSSVEGYNEVLLDTPIVMTDDFWLSIAPVTGGYPRQFAQDQVEPCHSYLSDGAGGWDQWTATGGKYYENFNYVYLEPYSGADIYPPNARDLTGTDCFQDFDMNLTLTVHDQNPVTSPMSSQYSLDGGSTWTDFNMISAKGSYTFTGTIPGQPDGTTGIVKFNLDDGINTPVWSNNYNIMWSKDLPLFVEDFENTSFPPSGWTLVTTGAGWVEGSPVTGGFAHSGSKSATHLDDSGAQDDWLITPVISIPPDPSATLNFWETVYWTQYMNGINEICVTVDGGATFTQIWAEDAAFVAANIIDGDFYYRSATLSAYAGQDIQLGFHYTGDYGCQWYIDDIEVLYDYEAPSITSIIANEALSPVVGAYLNNDMLIILDIYDVTGVASVVGHYTFDGGTTIVDVDFSQSKGGTEYWTGTIPAMASVSSGTINFDLTDIGGLSGTSTDYNIEFVYDDGIPVINLFDYGDPVFVTDDMNLKLYFSDESAISSCTGYYSKDDFATSVPVTMTPSKINDYMYV
ncbi:MAG: choice-of-anchor J domain-containing protein [Candidatus Delongbacteria bacterium]|nr:choice-of-anchor J domain-containing protein [Candidatus Delongbacteria bacterium]